MSSIWYDPARKGEATEKPVVRFKMEEQNSLIQNKTT